MTAPAIRARVLARRRSRLRRSRTEVRVARLSTSTREASEAIARASAHWLAGGVSITMKPGQHFQGVGRRQAGSQQIHQREPHDPLQKRQFIPRQRLRETALADGVEQPVLARAAQVRVHQQRTPSKLCKSDGQLGAQLRTPFGGAGTENRDHLGLIRLVVEHQLGTQQADLLAARIVRIVHQCQVLARHDLVDLGNNFSARLDTTAQRHLGHAESLLTLSRRFPRRREAHVVPLSVGVNENSPMTGMPRARSTSSRQRMRRLTSSS